MSEAKTTEGVVSTTVPTMSTFPNLLEAKSVMKNGKPTGDPKFSINLEFKSDHADLGVLKAEAMKAAKAKWPGRDFKTNFQWPFSSGDKLADQAKAKGKDREFSRGRTVLTSRSKYEPRLSAIVDGRLIDFEGSTRAAAKPYFYNGVEVLAQVNFVPYEGVGNGMDGVTAYLNMVLSLNKGDKLSGGGQSAAEVFKSYIGVSADTDPTAGMDPGDGMGDF